MKRLIDYMLGNGQVRSAFELVDGIQDFYFNKTQLCFL
jgi:hypothetical protein